MYLLLHIFLMYCVLQCCYFSQNIDFMRKLSSWWCVQRFLSKMKLVKNSLRTRLKQTNLENWFHISKESPKEGLNDTVFQYFADELKHCNSDMWMDLQLLVPVFLCLYSTYLVAMLPFRMIFLITWFALFLFLVNLPYFSPLLQVLFAIFNENLSQ